MKYSKSWYGRIAAGCRASAEVVVPLVLDSMGTPAVVDVGCGEGWWARQFAAYGCDVVCMDGAHVERRPEQFLERDLTVSIDADGTYDLAVCLEVAEHLPPERGESFIEELCELAPVVVFSAAIPGQGGEGHINCQWPAYWADLFEQHGFEVSGALRFELWNDERVEPWYRQNLLIAARRPGEFPDLFRTALAHPWPLVHPKLWEWATK